MPASRCASRRTSASPSNATSARSRPSPRSTHTSRGPFTRTSVMPGRAAAARAGRRRRGPAAATRTRSSTASSPRTRPSARRAAATRAGVASRLSATRRVRTRSSSGGAHAGDGPRRQEHHAAPPGTPGRSRRARGGGSPSSARDGTALANGSRATTGRPRAASARRRRDSPAGRLAHDRGGRHRCDRSSGRAPGRRGGRTHPVRASTSDRLVRSREDELGGRVEIPRHIDDDEVESAHPGVEHGATPRVDDATGPVAAPRQHREAALRRAGPAPGS